MRIPVSRLQGQVLMPAPMPTREELAERRRQKRLAQRKHWRGALAQPPCAAGVDLVARCGPRLKAGWLDLIPCNGRASAIFACDRRVTPTVEEVEAGEREMAASFGLAVAVIAAIPADKTILSGEMPCPKCGGRVRWNRSPLNGHRRAACEAGCIAFME